MINVKELITDPDFAQNFTIERHSQGTFVDGLYSSMVTTINVYGIVQPYQPKTVEYTPNGDQITGDIKIWLTTEIYTTRDVPMPTPTPTPTPTIEPSDLVGLLSDEPTPSPSPTPEPRNSGISDIIVYKDERYKVTYVKDWKFHGYFSAVAKRMSAK